MAQCSRCHGTGKEPSHEFAPDFPTADLLLAALSREDGRKYEVYKGRFGGWFVTYGGRTTSQAVSELVKRGAINSVYSNCPHDAYHIGKTVDVERTIAERKRQRAKTPVYYIGDNP